MKQLLVLAALALTTNTVSAWHWYSPQNVVTGKGSADSTASTYGDTSTHGNQKAYAFSGAYNISTAGAQADFSKTKSSFDSNTKGTDITSVTTKFDGESQDSGDSYTHDDISNYDGQIIDHDRTDSSFVDNKSYQGINRFNSTTTFNAGTWNNSQSLAVGVTTNASSVGGSFGESLGYNANTNAQYGGSAGSWGKFNLKAVSPY